MKTYCAHGHVCTGPGASARTRTCNRRGQHRIHRAHRHIHEECHAIVLLILAVVVIVIVRVLTPGGIVVVFLDDVPRVPDLLEALLRVVLLALIRAAAGLERERRVGRARTGVAVPVSCTRRVRWPGPRPGARDRQYRRGRWRALARTVSSPSAANALATSGRSGIVRRAHKGRKGSRGRRFGKNCNPGVTRWLCRPRFLADAHVPRWQRLAAVSRYDGTPTEISVGYNSSQ
jgi:hypothetical protein